VIRCLYCEAPLEDRNNEYHQCGKGLDGGEPSYRTEGDDSPNSYELLKLFIGPSKANFYLSKWEKDSLLSWNWPAFLFSWFWLGYRKLYSHLFILLGIFVIIDIFSFYLGNQDSAIGMTFAILYGLFGNYFYQKHVERKIKKILKEHGSLAERHVEITRKGGTSKWGILASLGILVLYVLITMGIYAILSTI
jgi:hypothetical protein